MTALRSLILAAFATVAISTAIWFSASSAQNAPRPDVADVMERLERLESHITALQQASRGATSDQADVKGHGSLAALATRLEQLEFAVATLINQLQHAQFMADKGEANAVPEANRSTSGGSEHGLAVGRPSGSQAILQSDPPMRTPQFQPPADASLYHDVDIRPYILLRQRP